MSSGFVERRKSKKITNLLPTSTGTALITVLPEQLQSPQLTAEWEHRLKEIERGEIAPDSFMDGIAAMLHELVQTYKPIPGTEVLFPSGREVVGRCPRCGAEVTESPKGFFCENHACSFVLWKNSRFFTAKKKGADKIPCRCAFEKWPRPAERLLLRKDRENLRCRCSSGGRWAAHGL